MALIQLRHDKRLGYAAGGRQALPALPDAWSGNATQATVISFRPPAHGRAHRVVRGVHACRRWTDVPAGDLVLYGLETDSPLAPLILWDLAHAAAVGSRLVVRGESLRPTYLERSYFATGLVLEGSDDDQLVFRKTAALPAERDAGLDRWSFCIPVGPEDATILNAVVRRILELDVPTKEILLCGRPGANFRYFDRVRIVGEDITAPPVQICAKKNRLALEAQYENLCILHDRVFLPLDFHRAVTRFGDHFPLTTFQSLYFDDRFNAVPRRYSDFNVAPRVSAQPTRSLMRDNDPARLSQFAPATLAVTEEQGFYYANPLRHSRHAYATGSLYLCKRAVWLHCPQDETLYWTEFEDIEQGFRADTGGVPSRVNPHGLYQSVIARPLLSISGAVHYETMRGTPKVYRAPLEPLQIPRKPLLKMTQEHGQRLLARFAGTHTAAHVTPHAPANAVLSTRLRARALLHSVHRARVPIQRKAIDRLLTDFEKQVVFDQCPYAWRESMTHLFLQQGGQAVAALVRDNPLLLNQFSQRPKGQVFAAGLKDYFPRRGLGTWLGSCLSALVLTWKNRHLMYLPGHVVSRFRAIWNSTPFEDYLEVAR